MMNTPKTFEEWWYSKESMRIQGFDVAIFRQTWNAAQAAMENPWREWAKEKPPIGSVILIEYITPSGVRSWYTFSYNQALDDNWWQNVWSQRTAWKYMQPSPFSAPVQKSEADIAYEAYCKKHGLVCVLNSSSHFDFTNGFNIGLKKGKV